jgi:hypothetical protein
LEIRDTAGWKPLSLPTSPQPLRERGLMLVPRRPRSRTPTALLIPAQGNALSLIHIFSGQFRIWPPHGIDFDGPLVGRCPAPRAPVVSLSQRDSICQPRVGALLRKVRKVEIESRSSGRESRPHLESAPTLGEHPQGLFITPTGFRPKDLAGRLRTFLRNHTSHLTSVVFGLGGT